MRNIPYGHQLIDKNDVKAVTESLQSGWLTQGPKVIAFEQALAKYCGAKYAVAVTNGSAALHLAYLAAGLGHGNEVITTPNTFVATTNMLLVVGARPVFCDIRLDTYNIDESKIEKLITSKTKAIVPVHFAGQPCQMDKITKLAKKYKLLIIEDAAHALGAKYKNKKIGNISNMTVFSFHPVKSITTGEGGAILTSNKDYYQKLMHLRSHGIAKDKNGFNVMTKLGYNYRMTDIQAALGLSQLKKLDYFIKQRHKIVKWYKKELADIPGILLPQEINGLYSARHLYVIRTKNPENRLPLISYLREHGIGANFHYPAVYSHPYYQKNGYTKTTMENMDEYHKTAITIPLFPSLSRADVKYVSALIKNFF